MASEMYVKNKLSYLNKMRENKTLDFLNEI